MLTGKDIVILSSLDWRSLQQTPQEVAMRLGEAGNKILFVENLGIRSARAKDLSRILYRAAHCLKDRLRLSPERGRVHVLSPLAVPIHGRPTVRWLNKRLLRYQIRAAISKLDMKAVILWIFLPSEMTLDLIQNLSPVYVVYHCLEDFTAIPDVPLDLEKTETSIVVQSDYLIVPSPYLKDKLTKGSTNYEIEIVAEGVDDDFFV